MKNTYEFQTVLIIDKATIVLGLNLIIQFNFTPCQLYVLFWMNLSFLLLKTVVFFKSSYHVEKNVFYVRFMNKCIKEWILDEIFFNSKKMVWNQ